MREVWRLVCERASTTGVPGREVERGAGGSMNGVGSGSIDIFSLRVLVFVSWIKLEIGIRFVSLTAGKGS